MDATDDTRVVRMAIAMMSADLDSDLTPTERGQLLLWLQDEHALHGFMMPESLPKRIVTYMTRCRPRIAPVVHAALQTTERSKLGWGVFESPREMVFAAEWANQGLDLLYPLSPQYPVKNGAYRLDFAYPPVEFGIEIYGYMFHSDREAFDRDHRRRREIEAQGWRVVVFTGDEVLRNAARCVHEAAYMLDIWKRRKDG